MNKLEKHVYIHQLRKEGFGIAAIARKCGISRNTVYTYLEKDFNEVSEWVQELKTRSRKLDPYEGLILDWLREHPDLSASQISDWLEEKHGCKGAGDSTVRTYVRELRERYHIPKTLTFRSFEALEELPKGKQLQVDFGEQKVKTTKGKTIKLYVIAFVLAHSRYKYAEWQDRPFTTRDVLRTHENAFQYFGGMTSEIVYDQDKLMTVSENAGDIVFTEEFQRYRTNRGFQVHLCRKSDPQSKGKVENAVKFIKYNFGKNRTFHQIETWNEQCLSWLMRKGNYQVHDNIKKRPLEVFALEKPHLRKISSPLSFESQGDLSIPRTVHKDNVIKFKSNRYTVPLGTYTPFGENLVSVKIQDNQLIISLPSGGEPIAVHPLESGKGKLIKNTHHSRDRSQGIADYMEAVKETFADQEKITVYVEEIYQRYPRYVRDQLQLLQRVIHDYEVVKDEALDICTKENLWSANDFHDVAKHLAKHHKECAPLAEEISVSGRVPEALLKEKAELRELDGYIQILGGGQ